MQIKNNIFKIILISLLALGFTACNDNESSNKIKSEKKVKLPKPEWDNRLTNYKNTIEWYQLADDDEIAASNIGVVYSKEIKDYKKAIEWYLYSDSIKTDAGTLLGLATSYEDIKNYETSIKYYKKSFELGNKNSAYNLALLYEDILKDDKNSEIWYKKGIEKKNLSSLKGIISLYYKNNEYIKTSAYMINIITYPNFTKEEVINRLKNYYKLDNETIKKGYELQLTMPGLPKRYKGKLDLDE